MAVIASRLSYAVVHPGYGFLSYFYAAAKFDLNWHFVPISDYLYSVDTAICSADCLNVD